MMSKVTTTAFLPRLKSWVSCLRLYEEWDKDFKIDFFPIVAQKIRDGGSILIYCSHHLLGEYLSKIPKELKLRQIIHWRKEGVVPSICNRLYAWSIEYILWFTKATNYTFNKKEWQNYTDVIVTNLKYEKGITHIMLIIIVIIWFFNPILKLNWSD